MTRVMVDAEMRKKLLGCTTLLELCDESGDVVAKLIPCVREIDPNEWIDLTPDLTDEELEKEIESGDEGYSTQEIIDEIKRIRGL
jgi:hypothetical protein